MGLLKAHLSSQKGELHHSLNRRYRFGQNLAYSNVYGSRRWHIWQTQVLTSAGKSFGITQMQPPPSDQGQRPPAGW